MSLTAGKTAHLKNLSTPQGVIAAAAMDQRGSLKKSIASAKGVAESAVTDEMMAEFKVAVTKILTPHASAILLDPEYGIPASKARALPFPVRSPRRFVPAIRPPAPSAPPNARDATVKSSPAAARYSPRR